MPLTSITTVRERGGLQAASYAGAVTDAQLTAAINLASHRMVEVCGWPLYQSVVALDETALSDTMPDALTGRTNAQKKSDFIDAESYFAVARLTKVSQVGKLTETGIPMSSQVGREVKTFAPSSENTDTFTMWEMEGFKCLAAYLGAATSTVGDDAYAASILAPVDAFNNPTCVGSSNRKIQITAF